MAPRSLPPASASAHKKRKAPADDGWAVDVAALEAQLTRAVHDGGSLNPLADLLAHARASPTRAPRTSKAIYALYRVVVVIAASGKLAPGGDEDAKAARAWIWARFDEYADVLCGLLQDEDKGLRTSALQILMSLLKHLSTMLSTPGNPQLHTDLFKKIVHALLVCPSSHRVEPSDAPSPQKKARRDGGAAQGALLVPDVHAHFLDTWLSVHDDVRWFFLREAATLLGSYAPTTHPHAATNLLALLERLATFPTAQKELNEWWIAEFGAKPPKPASAGGDASDASDDEATPAVPADADEDWRTFFDTDDAPAAPGKAAKPGHARAPAAKKPAARPRGTHRSLHALGAHRAVFTRAWLALLPALGDDARAARALAVLHRAVLPHLTRPVLVMDWVASCVDRGGTPGLLALNALFVLMTQYNLDYPSFYTRLYAFLDRDLLHVVHRARALRLLATFLSSTHLPATLLAAFLKRLARLAQAAPPAAVVALVPFTYNLLKQHPALMALIHRPGGGPDPYDAAEPDPQKAGALDSSLWELAAHAAHYHAPAGALAKVFAQPFTKPGYALDEFVDHSYATMFEAEAKKKMRREPPVGETGQAGLALAFPRATEGVPGPTGRDVVAELWSFGV